MAQIGKKLWTEQSRNSLFGLAVTVVAALPHFGVAISNEQSNDILLILGGLYALASALFASTTANGAKVNPSKRPPAPLC